MDFSGNSAQYGDVSFTFNKLLPREARDVFELVRVALSSTIDGDIDEDTAGPVLAVRMLLGLPIEARAEVEARLWRAVYFSSPNVKSRTRLAGMEDTAFKDLEPVHMYFVLAQAFVVNFQQSFDVFRSLMPSARATSSRPSPGTSTPSSRDPSTPG